MGRKAQKQAQRSAIRPEEVRLGRINGVFGLRGEVRLYLYNRESDLFAGDGAPVVLVSPDGERKASRIVSRSGAGKRVLGSLPGVENPEAARALQDWEIVADRSVFPPLPEGEYYHHDLIGMTVRTASGTEVGQLVEIFEGEQADVWVVKRDGEELLFPAVREVVLSVDADAGITVTDDTGAEE